MKSSYATLAALAFYGTVLLSPLESSAQSLQTKLAKEDTITLLARALWGEARSCALEERIAIGYTAINRQKKTKQPLTKILLSKYACFKGKSAEQVLNPRIYDDPKLFDQCLSIAQGLLQGKYRDPTNGATHYYNPRTERPYWADFLRGKKRIPTSKGPSKHIFGGTN